MRVSFFPQRVVFVLNGAQEFDATVGSHLGTLLSDLGLIALGMLIGALVTLRVLS
jgi:hypothetical protein